MSLKPRITTFALDAEAKRKGTQLDRADASITPERRLLVALIHRAVCDVIGDIKFRVRDTSWTRKETTRNMSAMRDAREWLMSDVQTPWSFRWCCFYLDMHDENIDLIRAAVALNN